MKSVIDQTAEELKAACTAGSVFAAGFSGDYLVDRTSGGAGCAEILVKAENAGDVAAVLSICSRNGIAVTPRGAGSGVTGGAIPSGGIVLSLEKMNRIMEIDSANSLAVVEPCVITGNLCREAEKYGLFYPVDPGSMDESSIGGNVAESAGGMSAVKYGTTKDYILGAEFVTPEGHIMHAGGKFVKNAAGYNILSLLAGSEGTLAVITKLVMRLIPLPVARRDILFAFDTLDDAVQAVHLISAARIIPTAVEFMERDAISLVSVHAGKEIPYHDAAAHLLVRVDAGSPEELDRLGRRVISAVKDRASHYMTARTPEESETLWSARRGIRGSIEKESPVFLAEDCAVPRSEIPGFVSAVKRDLVSRNLSSVIFGHAGDGNVHIDVLKRDMDDAKWRELLPVLKQMIYQKALESGGTITGEHGIGSLRKAYMPMQFSLEEIELMKRIKRAFDPAGILNPGKMI